MAKLKIAISNVSQSNGTVDVGIKIVGIPEAEGKEIVELYGDFKEDLADGKIDIFESVSLFGKLKKIIKLLGISK